MTKTFHSKTFHPHVTILLNQIANFGALRVPFDDSEASIVPRRNDGGRFPFDRVLWPAIGDDGYPEPVPVKKQFETELLESGLLGILTRRQHFSKIGWQESGLDGQNAEFWCLMQ